MAYSFDSKFDVTSLEQLDRRLGRVSAEAAPAVRKSNRAHAARMRDLIRAEMPVVGGTVKHRHPESKARSGYSRRSSARPGVMRGSVRSGASADDAWVKGGQRVPYFIVNEFGGAVKWRRGNKAHVIPIRERSPSLASLGLYDSYGGQRGAAGWHFYPTVRRYLPEIRQQAIEDAVHLVRTEITQSRIG